MRVDSSNAGDVYAYYGSEGSLSAAENISTQTVAPFKGTLVNLKYFEAGTNIYFK